MTINSCLRRISRFGLSSSERDGSIRRVLANVTNARISVIASGTNHHGRAAALRHGGGRPRIVRAHLMSNLTIVGLPTFRGGDHRGLLRNLVDLRSPISNVLLSVHSGPNNILASTIDITDLFVTSASIMRIENHRSSSQILSARNTTVLGPLPMIILRGHCSTSTTRMLTDDLRTRGHTAVINRIDCNGNSMRSIVPLGSRRTIGLAITGCIATTNGGVSNVKIRPSITLLNGRGA